MTNKIEILCSQCKCNVKTYMPLVNQTIKRTSAFTTPNMSGPSPTNPESASDHQQCTQSFDAKRPLNLKKKATMRWQCCVVYSGIKPKISHKFYSKVLLLSISIKIS